MIRNQAFIRYQISLGIRFPSPQKYQLWDDGMMQMLASTLVVLVGWESTVVLGIPTYLHNGHKAVGSLTEDGKKWLLRVPVIGY